MIRNLGKAISIFAEAEGCEHFMYQELKAFGAPNECYADVARGGDHRMRRARKHAEAVAGAPWRVICREAAKRTSRKVVRQAMERVSAKYANPFDC